MALASNTRRADLELKAAAILELNRRRTSKKTVFGIVCPEKGLLYAITRTENTGKWVKTKEKPSIYIAKKMERVLRSDKRFIVLIGGRGSSKSVGVVDLCIADAKDSGAKTYCLREFQSSIKNSVHSLIKEEIGRFGFDGFDVLNQSINCNNVSVFEFAGLSRNVASVKSTHGFKRFTVEEAQFMSQDSIDALTPTIRKKPKNGLPRKFLRPGETDILDDIRNNPELGKVSIIFIANPGSSADPFSKRFIAPFESKMDKDGIYEDELHLIVKMNHPDNPWFEDSGLEIERAWDWENRDRAYYYHRWEGAYYDSVDNAIIRTEWFDAAIDAHINLGFKPRGARIVSHDPADTASAKALADRQGPVVFQVKETILGDVNDGCDWALEYAKNVNADEFTWDGDGLGASLRRDIANTLTGTKTTYQIFKGSEGVENPEDFFQDTDKPADDYKQKRKNKDTFYNKRAQFYWYLRDRFYKTYCAIVKGEYHDPDELISISSDIEDIAALRSQVCRVPRKPNNNGLIQIMTKEEMAKLKISSPHMADCLMMSMHPSSLADTRPKITVKPDLRYIV